MVISREVFITIVVIKFLQLVSIYYLLLVLLEFQVSLDILISFADDCSLLI